jgi:hypothetical protein
MMKQRSVIPVIIAALVLCLFILPATAVIHEVTMKGTVSTLSPQKNTLTIENPVQYGCSYPATGAPVCSYTPMNVSVLTGTVPDSAAFTVLKTGDPVVATSLGGAGGTWITLAKLYGSRPNEEFVTDIIGEPGTIPTPLIGDYALDLAMTPDCSACTGTTCNAVSSDVSVKSGGSVVLDKTLLPRQLLTYNGRNDGSSVAVTFVNGKASSASCAGRTGMAGPQPVSVFVVTVVPPVGYAQNNLRTASTTSPEEALTAVPAGTAAPVPAATPVPTRKSGDLPLAAVGAAGMVVALHAYRRK